MDNISINRFEWLKAVNRSDLLPRAKIVAVALALDFFNEETGQLNPGTEKLAEASGATLDTVKRGIRDLVSDGWLGRTEGRGRGNKTTFRLCSPGKVINLSTPKKGAPVHQIKGGTGALLPKEKGAPVHRKGGTGALSYIEQSSEQKGRAWQAFERHRFTGSCRDGLTYLSRKQHYHELNQWAEWVRNHDLPKLCQMSISEQGVFAMPYRHPPTDPAQCDAAMSYFVAMTNSDEVHHAAQ